MLEDGIVGLAGMLRPFCEWSVAGGIYASAGGIYASAGGLSEPSPRDYACRRKLRVDGSLNASVMDRSFLWHA